MYGQFYHYKYIKKYIYIEKNQSYLRCCCLVTTIKNIYIVTWRIEAVEYTPLQTQYFLTPFVRMATNGVVNLSDRLLSQEEGSEILSCPTFTQKRARDRRVSAHYIDA